MPNRANMPWTKDEEITLISIVVSGGDWIPKAMDILGRTDRAVQGRASEIRRRGNAPDGYVDGYYSAPSLRRPPAYIREKKERQKAAEERAIASTENKEATSHTPPQKMTNLPLVPPSPVAEDRFAAEKEFLIRWGKQQTSPLGKQMAKVCNDALFVGVFDRKRTDMIIGDRPIHGPGAKWENLGNLIQDTETLHQMIIQAKTEEPTPATRSSSDPALMDRPSAPKAPRVPEGPTPTYTSTQKSSTTLFDRLFGKKKYE